MTTPGVLSRPLQRLAEVRALDAAAARLAAITAGRRGLALEWARGEPLGHPAHPALTDLPIGFWTSAWVLDIFGGRRAAPAARALVGWGVVSAVPTIATGLADVPTLTPARQRVAVVHAAVNAVATAGFIASWYARRRGHRASGIAWGLAAGTLASLGGYLGGWLAFGDEPTHDDTATDQGGAGPG